MVPVQPSAVRLRVAVPEVEGGVDGRPAAGAPADLRGGAAPGVVAPRRELLPGLRAPLGAPGLRPDRLRLRRLSGGLARGLQRALVEGGAGAGPAGRDVGPRPQAAALGAQELVVVARRQRRLGRERAREVREEREERPRLQTANSTCGLSDSMTILLSIMSIDKTITSTSTSTSSSTSTTKYYY